MNTECSHGPVHTLPGTRHSVLPGSHCDNHQTSPAVARIQGETDSFGCEYHNLCQTCFDQHKAEETALKGGSFLGTCGCETQNTPMYAYRCWDEGQSGPVYYQCAECRTKRFEREAQEVEDVDSEPMFDFHAQFDGED